MVCSTKQDDGCRGVGSDRAVSYALWRALTSIGHPERERDVLRLLAEGHTQPRIAEALLLSPHTADTHFRHTYARLHVHTGAAAVSKALRERLIG